MILLSIFVFFIGGVTMISIGISWLITLPSPVSDCVYDNSDVVVCIPLCGYKNGNIDCNSAKSLGVFGTIFEIIFIFITVLGIYIYNCSWL